MPALTDQMLRLAVMAAVLYFVARPALDFHVTQWAGSLLIGVAIFVLWIAPDLLFPSYRHSFLFDNALLGAARSSMPEAARHDVPVLLLRSLRAVIVVPIVEELFWRGWLMRWMIAQDFRARAAGRLLGAIVLDGRAAVRERTWCLLGRGPGGGNYFQLVDDPHQESGRSDSGARSGQRLPERLRDRGGEMGILAVTRRARSGYDFLNKLSKAARASSALRGAGPPLPCWLDAGGGAAAESRATVTRGLNSVQSLA